jgi:glycosyltransferase involved in cell wall biosynthesis
MKMVITTVRMPFVHGGAEVLAEGLRDTLREAGHQVEIVAVPFKGYPPERLLDQMLACRLLDISETCGVAIDRVIGLKFPAYYINHPSKVLWMLHQHRAAYDLWGGPFGDMGGYPRGSEVRDAIWQADRRLLPEAQAIYTIAANVSGRLKRYCGVDSQPLYHPPAHAERFYSAEAEDYFFFPSRLDPTKRQTLVVEAMALTKAPVRVRFAGTALNPRILDELKTLARSCRVADRVEWLGKVSEEQKRDLYARSLAVVFPPVDEDYGYITLEAMLSAKAVITCTDSGGPLEFVVPEQTGIVCDPTPQALGAAMDRFWQDRTEARVRGEAGQAHYRALGISWNAVVERLAA